MSRSWGNGPRQAHFDGGGAGDIAEIDADQLLKHARRLAAASELARNYPKLGGRHDAAFVLGGFLARCGFSPAQAAVFVEAVGAASDQPGEKRRDMARTARDGATAEKRAGYPKLVETFGEKTAKKVADWLEYKGEEEPQRRAGNDADFICGAENRILKSRHENIKLAVERLGVSLRYNEFSGQPEIAGLPDFESELTDAAEIRLRFRIAETFGFRPDGLLFRETLVDIAHANRFHPVKDFLSGLRWDGTPRVDRWLSTYGGAEDTEFNRAVGRLILLAAVRRVREPGCKFDALPVLEGLQGRNKSEALRLMATRDEWFTDCLELGATPKEVIEQTRGAWIVELSELGGLGTREEGRIKASLSRRVDKARAAYGHYSEQTKRQFVAIGTINVDSEYLKEDGRRYWPVRIAQFDLAALSRDVEQLWAEAAVREAAGESLVLPVELWSEAAAVRADRVQENPYREKLAGLVERRNWIASRDVWAALDINHGNEQAREGKRVGQAMRLLGFVRHVSRGDDRTRELKRDDAYYERAEPLPDGQAADDNGPPAWRSAAASPIPF